MIVTKLAKDVGIVITGLITIGVNSASFGPFVMTITDITKDGGQAQKLVEFSQHCHVKNLEQEFL